MLVFYKKYARFLQFLYQYVSQLVFEQVFHIYLNNTRVLVASIKGEGEGEGEAGGGEDEEEEEKANGFQFGMFPRARRMHY
ncbi:hypothetical protein V9T40_007431 [Parthenolecanium corni]|uniref:Uncharacterized protein n=1 Tax=Parthenolecanium corni TaxID=536013 RepID=A0AAN9U504_9HEMI